MGGSETEASPGTLKKELGLLHQEKDGACQKTGNSNRLKEV